MNQFRRHLQENRKSSPPKRPAVLSYIHKLPRNLKKVYPSGSIYWLFFSAPFPFYRAVSDAEKKRKKRGFSRNTSCHSADALVALFTEFLFLAAECAWSKSGVASFLGEHHASWKGVSSGNLAVHVDRCGCPPNFKDADIKTN